MRRVELRDYQAAAFEQAREYIRQGARSVLIVSPTGSGKTVLASAVMEMCTIKGKRATFVVDRQSLVDQTSATFMRYGLEHGVIQASHPNFRPSLPVQICSIQTLARRGWPQANIDVFDEAHVLHAAHKARLASKSTVVIGLTATPFTKGLGKHYDAVVNVATTRKLIQDGWLSPYRAYSCVEPDMTGVTVKSTGEWDEEQASKKSLEVVGDVVAEYLRLGEGRKFICSAVSTAHVEELVRKFQAAGINAVGYTYKDKAEDRADITAEFRRPDSGIRGLVTVTAASRGFDVPDVSCVIMARPLRKSLAEHIQLLGRGLRISPETGKRDCIVLCHSGNMARFWQDCEAFFDDGVSDLDDGKPKSKKVAKKKEPEPVKCPQCATLHKPMPFCPSCGHEYPRRQAVQHVPGTLKELIAGNYSRELSRDVFPMVAHWVIHQRKRQGDIARRMAQAIFRDMTGDFAKATWDSVVPIPPTQEVASRLRSLQIRFAKGTGRSPRMSSMPPVCGETRPARAEGRL